MIAQTPPNLDQLSVGEIAATLPGATAVFRAFKVNFCCHGDVSLAEAAHRRGVKPAELKEALQALEGSDASLSLSIGTDELIDHIFNRYHEVHRRELTELVELARKVEAVHTDHPDVPHGLGDLLQQMRSELDEHMRKEELILFPAMRHGAETKLDGPITQMRHDHDDHGEHLQRLEALTNDFTPPVEACRSWRAVYTGAAKLSEDLMEHVHLENNVLFPRFQEIPTP